jgi:hypothetical protein
MLNVSHHTNRLAHGQGDRPPRGEGSRQTMIVAAVGALLALSLLATGGYAVSKKQSALVATALNDDEIYTGSILYVPDEGRICHQILFNNLTGLLRDNGRVDCERAAYHGDDSMRLSSARVRVISTGFRDR